MTRLMARRLARICSSHPVSSDWIASAGRAYRRPKVQRVAPPGPALRDLVRRHPRRRHRSAPGGRGRSTARLRRRAADGPPFSGTVYENLTLYDPSVPRETVRRAAALTEAASFIRALPNGYDTLLSGSRGDGTQLSAGQWQLLAL